MRKLQAGATRRQRCGLLAGLLALLISGACEGNAPAEIPRLERVVLISIDTLRADRVGVYGAERAHTPTLDALAEGGVRFETVLSPAPLTLPSHTTLLTGLDPPQHGVRHNGIFRLDSELETLATRLREQGFATAAFVGAVVLGHRYGLARGFDHYDDRVEYERSARGLRGYAERPADAVMDAVLAWLQDAPARFFLWVHFYDPHSEYDPPPGFAAAFPGDPHAGEVAFVDRQIGRLLEALDARYAGTETLIAVTSDHGESFGEHGESTHSHFLYDSTQRIPLILQGPGVPAGRVVSGLTSLRDVAPTLLELAGVPPLPGTGDRSLLGRIEGRDAESEPAYLETLAPQFDWNLSPLLGLRGEDWKYVRAPRPELYDLREDPGETRNLAGEQPERVRELDALLGARLADARPARPNLDLDEEEQERLQALGYVAAPWQAQPGALRPGEVGGRDPKDGIVMIRAVNEADRLLAAGEAEAAMQLLEEFAEEQSVALLNIRATAALAVGDLELAERSLRAGIELAPVHMAAHSRLAQLLLASERADEARAVYEGMLRIDPAQRVAHTGLGALAEAQGDLAGAERWYLRAYELSAPEAGWRLAALWLEAGRLAEADALLADLDEGELEREAVALRLAIAERSVERWASARERLERGLSNHPDSGELRLELARVLLAQDEEEAAREQLEGALQVAEQLQRETPSGQNAVAALLRARALLWLGRREEARSALRASLAGLDTLPPTHRQAARALAAELEVSVGETG
ncbi:MAG: sulfatase-like hydrolase/transferase [Myxococcota bacterium]